MASNSPKGIFGLYSGQHMTREKSAHISETSRYLLHSERSVDDESYPSAFINSTLMEEGNVVRGAHESQSQYCGEQISNANCFLDSSTCGGVDSDPFWSLAKFSNIVIDYLQDECTTSKANNNQEGQDDLNEEKHELVDISDSYVSGVMRYGSNEHDYCLASFMEPRHTSHDLEDFYCAQYEGDSLDTHSMLNVSKFCGNSVEDEDSGKGSLQMIKSNEDISQENRSQQHSKQINSSEELTVAWNSKSNKENSNMLRMYGIKKPNVSYTEENYCTQMEVKSHEVLVKANNLDGFKMETKSDDVLTGKNDLGNNQMQVNSHDFLSEDLFDNFYKEMKSQEVIAEENHISDIKMEANSHAFLAEEDCLDDFQMEVSHEVIAEGNKVVIVTLRHSKESNSSQDSEVLYNSECGNYYSDKPTMSTKETPIVICSEENNFSDVEKKYFQVNAHNFPAYDNELVNVIQSDSKKSSSSQNVIVLYNSEPEKHERNILAVPSMYDGKISKVMWAEENKFSGAKEENIHVESCNVVAENNLVNMEQSNSVQTKYSQDLKAIYNTNPGKGYCDMPNMSSRIPRNVYAEGSNYINVKKANIQVMSHNFHCENTSVNMPQPNLVQSNSFQELKILHNTNPDKSYFAMPNMSLNEIYAREKNLCSVKKVKFQVKSHNFAGKEKLLNVTLPKSKQTSSSGELEVVRSSNAEKISLDMPWPRSYNEKAQGILNAEENHPYIVERDLQVRAHEVQDKNNLVNLTPHSKQSISSQDLKVLYNSELGKKYLIKHNKCSLNTPNVNCFEEEKPSVFKGNLEVKSHNVLHKNKLNNVTQSDLEGNNSSVDLKVVYNPKPEKISLDMPSTSSAKTLNLICPNENIGNDLSINFHDVLDEINKLEKGTHIDSIMNTATEIYREENQVEQIDQNVTFVRTSPGQKLIIKLKYNDKQYVCEICNEPFDNFSDIKSHLHVHKVERSLECSICWRKFLYQKSYRKHVRHCFFRKTCTICGKMFVDNKTLRAHVRTHKTKLLYACYVCHAKFNKKEELQFHMHIHVQLTKSNIFCSNDPSSSRNTRRPKDKTLFVCEICKQTFIQPELLKMHMLSHSGIHRCNCTGCQRSFETSSRLETQMHRDSREGNYTCSECGLNFSCRKRFILHLRCHFSEETFVCDICGMNFTRKKDIRKHVKIHMIALKASEHRGVSASHGNVNQHFGLHFEERLYKCGVCGVSCVTQDDITQHLMTHTGNGPYSCVDCNMMYPSQEYLQLHKLSYH